MHCAKRVTHSLHLSAARAFSTSSRLQSISNLSINADRLWETLHETCEWGAAHRFGEYALVFFLQSKPHTDSGISNRTDTGMARLTLNDDDARVRWWFADEVQKLGCTLSVDQMGNMFARQTGQLKSSAPMIAMGSHLDTQPRGGRYDGILGIMAALEVLRTMKENDFQTHFDVGVVNWTKYVLNEGNLCFVTW